MVKYEIQEVLATISSTNSTTKLLTVTSWNGNPGKLDIRTWRNVDGEQVPGKGTTLTPDEARIVCDALSAYLEAADED